MLSYILSDTHMLLFATKIIIMQDENIMTNDDDSDATIHVCKILSYLLDFNRNGEMESNWKRQRELLNS